MFFQCSLILEHCSKGDLRSYLISHKAEFVSSLEYYENNKNLDPIFEASDDKIVHDMRLLYRWIYQANNRYCFIQLICVIIQWL